MPLLQTFIARVKAAIGLPQTIGIGVKRSVSRLLTWGLKGMGLDVKGIERQITKVFEKPVSPGERMDIRKLTAREELRKLAAAHNYVSGFPRNNMFETVFRDDRNYLYRMRLSVYDNKTRRTTEQWVSMYSNTNDNKETLYAIFRENMLEGYGGDKVQILDWNVEEVWHNKGKPY